MGLEKKKAWHILKIHDFVLSLTAYYLCHRLTVILHNLAEDSQ